MQADKLVLYTQHNEHNSTGYLTILPFNSLFRLACEGINNYHIVSAFEQGLKQAIILLRHSLRSSPTMRWSMVGVSILSSSKTVRLHVVIQLKSLFLHLHVDTPSTFVSNQKSPDLFASQFPPIEWNWNVPHEALYQNNIRPQEGR